MAWPLAGVKILEFTQIIAGPLGCQLLADLGADVIKVEPPSGEPWRLNAQFMPLESKTYMGLNRGKRSLAIDVSKASSQAAIHRLVKQMDVVAINYRPDVAKHLKIDYPTLASIKPDLIYVDNTAFGREGPLADRPGYDIVVQALSGLTGAVAKVDENGQPLTGPAVADTTTGYALCAGTVAALYHKAKTGEGQMVETSLLINALTIHMSQFASIPAGDAAVREGFMNALQKARDTGTPYSEFLKVREAMLRAAAGGNVYYRCFLTQDGAIAIGALSAALRAKVQATLGFEHNRDEPGYNAQDPEQIAIDKALITRTEERFKTKTTAEWDEILTAGGVPCGSVNFVQELLDHPQIVANEYVIEHDHELAGPVWMQASPWKMSKAPPKPTKASPPLGWDTDEVLSEAGLGAAEIAAMRAEGAIL